MASYRFRVMPTGQPYYETEGNGINWGVAKTNVARREGVNEGQVCYLGDIKEDKPSRSFVSSSDGDIGGYLILGAILFGIWLVVEYWWIVVPIAVILGILIIIGWNED